MAGEKPQLNSKRTILLFRHDDDQILSKVRKYSGQAAN
ncbi:hypothetical protein L248_1739 [Schleiferilactobacillus shenzhenensis LY-73]|uniref:Uncharacterized protein n=1 Tax=Schleiferilactobacillus shenzhenensis LY-73 TaxID=1231336 RepID=U4TGT4_9LACO|nr:hypothetical protein L248_1739 [Schleiferilactobacillus shenzhenensis LY-73]